MRASGRPQRTVGGRAGHRRKKPRQLAPGSLTDKDSECADKQHDAHTRRGQQQGTPPHHFPTETIGARQLQMCAPCSDRHRDRTALSIEAGIWMLEPPSAPEVAKLRAEIGQRSSGSSLRAGLPYMGSRSRGQLSLQRGGQF